MDLRRIKLKQELLDARTDLLNINLATDTTSRRGVSRSYALLDDWLIDHAALFHRVYIFTNACTRIGSYLSGYDQIEDLGQFNEIRANMVAIVDIGIKDLDAQQTIKPLLEEYILRVKDKKLAELLKEFNTSKDIAPNLAAMGFRTILCLIIQEKAKIVNPSSNTATTTDLSPDKMIDRARNDNILAPDEQRLIRSFVSTHKDIYDFVAHRPSTLIDKDEVDT